LAEPTAEIRFPGWLTKQYRQTDNLNLVERLLFHYGVNAVCHKARCPNMFECFSEKKLTFLLLGDICTRNCRFCSTKKGTAKYLNNLNEIEGVYKIINLLGIKYVILTSVTRDDLPDGGLNYYMEAVRKIKASKDNITLELLTPDFINVENAQEILSKSEIDVFSHNLETVKNLYDEIRPESDYYASLDLLLGVKKNHHKKIITKSGFMLGLGESESEVLGLLKDLKSALVDIVTIGQYLRPDKKCVPVREFIKPEKFEYYKKKALSMGLPYVSAGPFVRSSYKAKEIYILMTNDKIQSTK